MSIMKLHPPNLQELNIFFPLSPLLPLRDRWRSRLGGFPELGQEIRSAIIAQGADNIILAADYSQIELRL